MIVKNMELGEVREYNGKKYKLVKKIGTLCDGCCFENSDNDCNDSEDKLGLCLWGEHGTAFEEVKEV